MTDVRLTATNPDDSSVVPVACNSRGELLIEDVPIEQINNDVTINGRLFAGVPADMWGDDKSSAFWISTSNQRFGQIVAAGDWGFQIAGNGYRNTESEWISYGYENSTKALKLTLDIRYGVFKFEVGSDAPTGSSPFFPVVFSVGENGPSANTYTINRPDDARAWKESIDVFEELVFLRAQMRAVMGKLKMTPEGGQEVWDGSA